MWLCKDPVTGLQCVDLYGNFLFLHGTDSAFIQAHILALGTSYKLQFAAADQLDVSRISVDSVTVTTLLQGNKLLHISIQSKADSNNKQLNIFENQLFKAVILNNASNVIENLSAYAMTWTVVDSNIVTFSNFQSNMNSMTIDLGQLSPSNLYKVCITVSNTVTKEYGQACSTYNSYGDSNLFTFTVTPSTGFAFSTEFMFTSASTQLQFYQ